MATYQPLSLFISSKSPELADERRAVQAALKAYNLYGWIWEDITAAYPESMRSTNLQEVEVCDIYVGLFWLGYGMYAIEEYEYARKLNKPCLIYLKEVTVEQRSPELTIFLNRIEHEGLTICHFERPIELAEQVQKDVVHLLSTRFRESRRQSLPLPTSSSTSTGTKNKGMALSQPMQWSNGSLIKPPSP